MVRCGKRFSGQIKLYDQCTKIQCAVVSKNLSFLILENGEMRVGQLHGCLQTEDSQEGVVHAIVKEHVFMW